MSTLEENKGAYGPPVVSATQLVIGYPNNPLIKLDDFCVRGGEIIAVTGPSGVGKTTLLSCLSGEIESLDGKVEYKINGLNGKESRNYAARTIQSFPLFHWLTVYENLELSAMVKGAGIEGLSKLLELFSAQTIANRYPDNLSGGEKCRASICQALVGDPQLLLLDEPFNGLDIINKESISKNIIQWSKSSGAGVVLVTHDLFDAITYASRVIVVTSGEPGAIVAEVDTKQPDALAMIKRALVGEMQ